MDRDFARKSRTIRSRARGTRVARRVDMKARSILVMAPAMLITFVAACSGDGNQFPNGPGNGSNNGNQPGFGNGNGATDGGDLSKCATSSATPTPVPVSLVFMFDKSGSMDQSSKWTSCQSGLTSFFGDPKSVGLSASLQFFPQNSDECNTSLYAAPAVSMRALPDGTTFSTAMTANSPGGETPTLPALTGAIEYAQSVQKGNSTGKGGVVLVRVGREKDE